MFHYYYFCHIYLPNINHHMKSLMCTELQLTQLILRCVLTSGVSQKEATQYLTLTWLWFTYLATYSLCPARRAGYVYHYLCL